MKRSLILTGIGVAVVMATCLRATADTTVDPSNPYAYGANIGWLNAAGNGAQGLSIAQNVCEGYVFSPTLGWLHMGNGLPTNGVRYSNNHPTDYGVNRSDEGFLTGHAYCANAGWLTFEQEYGKPKVDLFSGQLSGYAWSGNLGWLSLSNTYGSVRVLSVMPGLDGDGDSLPDWWEYHFYGGTNAPESAAEADSDNDGVVNWKEHRAGTDPSDSSSLLEFKQPQIPGNGQGQLELSWPSSYGKRYTLTTASSLGGEWTTLVSGVEASPPMNSYTVALASITGYWRVKVE